MTDTNTKPTTVAEFEFRCHGVESPSYFQGAGVAFTPWDAVYTGVGRSEQKAATDAIDQMATSVETQDQWAADRMEEQGAELSDDETAIEECENESWREFCKAEGVDPDRFKPPEGETAGVFSQRFQDEKGETQQHYVSVFVRFGDPVDVEQALARHLDCSPDDVTEDGPSHYSGHGTMFKADGGEFAVMADDEADAAVAKYIEDSLWAFRAEFLADYTPEGIDADEITAIRGDRCEDANSAMLALVKVGSGLEDLVENAVAADGRGNFLSSYDCEESEIDGPDGETLYLYRTN